MKTQRLLLIVFFLVATETSLAVDLICNSSKKACKGYFLKRNSNQLLIYFRGITKPSPGNPITSSMYNLQSVNSEMSIYSTASHTYGLSENEIVQIMKKSGATKIQLASHSGGWQGLNKTLKAIRGGSLVEKIEGIFLLDNFYSREALAQTINGLFSRRFLAERCFGFSTPHLRDRFNQYYKNLCNANHFTHFPNGWHNKAVNKCLRKFTVGERCNESLRFRKSKKLSKKSRPKRL